MYVEVRPKHNSTMVSDASPGNADPKMNESFVHTEHVGDGSMMKHPPTRTTVNVTNDRGKGTR